MAIYIDIIPLFHHGYYGTIQYDKENKDQPYHGKTFGINNTDFIFYRGETPEDLRTNFISIVDKYINHCKELGLSTKPSSSFMPSIPFVRTESILEILDTVTFVDTTIVLPRVRDKFYKYLLTPDGKDDNEFPAGWYNLHRTLQYAKDYLLNHLSKYGVVQSNTVVCAPETIPDILPSTLTLDYGSDKNTYCDGFTALNRHLKEIVRSDKMECLCSSTLELFRFTEKGDRKTVDIHVTQFPDIM